MADLIKQVIGILDENSYVYNVHDDRIVIPFSGDSDDQEIGVEIRFFDADLPGMKSKVPVIHLRTDLLIGMPMEPESFSQAVMWTTNFNKKSFLLKAIVSVDESSGEDFGRVSLEADVLGTNLDAEELLIPIHGLASAGDAWDDQLASDLGGVTYAGALKAIRSAAPEVDS